ncbi:hypothetical protein Q9966_007467 [Columba livia]|nr:hypothetical protein Q9966_007467 [Columba livia]
MLKVLLFLQAFDMLRLKSCVSLKPYEGEWTCLKFEKVDGNPVYLVTGFSYAFDKDSGSFLDDLNTPYDYESVLQYGPYSFNINSNTPYITTEIPKFNEIIEQKLDFSRIDLLMLICMYNCS